MAELIPNQFLEQVLNQQASSFSEVMGTLSQEADRLRRQKLMQQQAQTEFDMRVKLGDIQFEQQKDLAKIQFGYQEQLTKLREGSDIYQKAMQFAEKAQETQRKLADKVSAEQKDALKTLQKDFPYLYGRGLKPETLFSRPQLDANDQVRFEVMVPGANGEMVPALKSASEIIGDVTRDYGIVESRIAKWQTAAESKTLTTQQQLVWEKFQTDLSAQGFDISAVARNAEGPDIMAKINSMLPEFTPSSEIKRTIETDFAKTFNELFPGTGDLRAVDKLFGFDNEEVRVVDKSIGELVQWYKDNDWGLNPSIRRKDPMGNESVVVPDNLDTVLSDLANQYAMITGMRVTDVYRTMTINPNWDRNTISTAFIPVGAPTAAPQTSSVQRSQSALNTQMGFTQ